MQKIFGYFLNLIKNINLERNSVNLQQEKFKENKSRHIRIKVLKPKPREKSYKKSDKNRSYYVQENKKNSTDFSWGKWRLETAEYNFQGVKRNCPSN
jgi:hypothetical protein